MRPVHGFDRPALQWLFVALAIVLIAVAATAAWHARRSAAAAARLEDVDGHARLENQRLDAQLARERSTREALALELSRLRAGGEAELPRTMPTLTLTPSTDRGATPPAATVTAQHGTQVVELRLVLPPRSDKPYTRFEAVLREWTGGDTLWLRGGLVAATIDSRPTVTALITGDVLRAGAYEVIVSGISREGSKDEVATYEFSVK